MYIKRVVVQAGKRKNVYMRSYTGGKERLVQLKRMQQHALKAVRGGNDPMLSVGAG